ncbi:MAG: aminopeptidase [Mycoplasmataceae bacterium]|nr:aminopeptidase [Mycoplasmataceae bacterium]
MINTKLLIEYAKLIVKVGANVQKNQVVVINSILEAQPLTKLVVEQAYLAGAKNVIVHWNDAEISKLNYKYKDLKTLSTIKQYEIDYLTKPIIEEGGCRISIGGNSPAAFKDVDSNKLKEGMKALSTALKDLRNWTMASKCQWTIAYYPSKAWAKMVFPKLSDEKAVEKLFEAILKTVRVGEKKSAIELWKQHNVETKKWATILNKYNFDYLTFKNKLGTNVAIKLVKNHIWESGGNPKTKTLPEFTPNLPTEEVWTMPDMNGINGVVVASKPLSYNGNIINNFKFEFKNGKVIKHEAKVGKKILDDILSIPGANRAGEIALVPKTSPINKTGILFYATLFDENASCHIALGASYPTNIKNGVDLSKDELKKLGSNDSIVHIDFMFGTDDMNVLGFKGTNKPVEIMKNGLLVI